MTNGKVTRIGHVTAGVVKESSVRAETNDPAPIVLWSAKGPPAAFFYYTSILDMAAGSMTQKISGIGEKNGAPGGKVGSLFGDYPVVVKSKGLRQEEMRHSDIIESETILNADVNGDGIDELIFARRLSGVSVYSAEKSLSRYKPLDFKPDQYDYTPMIPVKAGLGKHDVVLIAVNRTLNVPMSGLAPGEKTFHEKTENYLLLMVDASGITPVRLQNPDWKIGRVAGVGVVSGDANRIEELVAFTEKEGDTDLYLSRHRPDGASIGIPRKVYAPVPRVRTLEPLFTPGATRVVMADRANAQIYFVAPGKAANWIRVVDLKKTLPGNVPVLPLRAVKNGSRTLALVRQGTRIYALDEEGRFFTGKDGALAPTSERKPFISVTGESDAYRLVEVVAADGADDHLLVVETREPGTRPLSDAEVLEAGKKFVNDIEYGIAEGMGEILFDEDLKIEAEGLSKKKGTGHRIESLEDIRKYLPDYYNSLQSNARTTVRKILEGILLQPLSGKGSTIEEGDYKRKSEYLAWLKGVSRDGEVVLTALKHGGEVLGKVVITGYFYPNIDKALWMDRVQYRGRGNHGVAVLALWKRSFTEDGGTGYYRVDW
jgi:hypothetical protein